MNRAYSKPSYAYIIRTFARVGATAFGGWSSAALNFEKELVDHTGLLTEDQVYGAGSYAQILPGATQVGLASNLGYQLRGFAGSVVGTVSYLLPLLTIITIFAAVYFRFLHASTLLQHLKGLTAALAGIILANGYQMGKKHVSQSWMWG